MHWYHIRVLVVTDQDYMYPRMARLAHWNEMPWIAGIIHDCTPQNGGNWHCGGQHNWKSQHPRHTAITEQPDQDNVTLMAGTVTYYSSK